MQTFVRALGALLLAAVLFAGTAAAQTFTFTAIPDQDTTRLRERFGKVADYLSSQLGVPVAYVPVTSYPAAVTAFRNNQVQLAWFGGVTGVQARQLVPGSQAIAAGEADMAFHTYFIAHSSTGLTEEQDSFPGDIEGMTFTFGSKSSTSGRLMPEYYIRQHLGAPEEVFSRVGFSGDHTKTIQLVQSGAYQAGAVNFTVWQEENRLGNIDTDKVNIVWVTPPYPDYNWTIRGDVNERFGSGFTEKVRTALVEMSDPELLSAFPREAMVPATNEDFAPIAETARQIGLVD